MQRKSLLTEFCPLAFATGRRPLQTEFCPLTEHASPAATLWSAACNRSKHTCSNDAIPLQILSVILQGEMV